MKSNVFPKCHVLLFENWCLSAKDTYKCWHIIRLRICMTVGYFLFSFYLKMEIFLFGSKFH